MFIGKLGFYRVKRHPRFCWRGIRPQDKILSILSGNRQILRCLFGLLDQAGDLGKPQKNPIGDGFALYRIQFIEKHLSTHDATVYILACLIDLGVSDIETDVSNLGYRNASPEGVGRE